MHSTDMSNMNKEYDAYFIENKKGQTIPDCPGAIGLTIDDKLTGYKHVSLSLFAELSSSSQNLKKLDSYHNINLTHIMHGFVVTSKMADTTLRVCEAVAEGIISADIQIGDKDWTSMVLFVPKNQETANQVLLNAMHELKGDEKKQVADYAYFAGFVSVLTNKMFFNSFSERNAQIIAKEMTDYIKSRNIRNRAGGSKESVCTQLALRILRAATLIAAMDETKLQKYEMLPAKDLENKLFKKILNADSSLAKVIGSSNLFKMPADVQALPHELYLALKRHSDLH